MAWMQSKKPRDSGLGLIVMDISMPRLNGLEATREIRNILPQIAVVILSQHDSDEMMRQAVKAGALGYVVKSSIATDLLSALERASRQESFFQFEPGTSGIADANIDAQEILQRSAALERALRESEELYRSTFERAALGVAQLSPDGRWLQVNQKCCDILGYTKEELVRLKVRDITHPDDRDDDASQFEKIVAGHTEQYSRENRFIRKDGSLAWVNLSLSCVRDSQRRVKHLISVIEDINECKQAEQARFLLASIVESSEDAIISKDLTGIITSWNAGAQRIFGYSAKEAVGQPVTMIIPEDLYQEEVQILKRLKSGKRIEHHETVRVTKEGKRLDVSLTISPVRDSEGMVVGGSKIARDISEQKRLEEAVRRNEKELRKQLELEIRERTEELEQKNTKLEQQTQLVRDLSGHLLKGQDDERRRIARELHDSVGQLLAAMSMNSSTVVREKDKLTLKAGKCVEENITLAAQVLSEIRTISHLLHPPLLDEIGLNSALKWYVEGFVERSKIDVRLEISPDLGRLAPDVEISLFRIVQECLINVHRHSESASASVRVSRSPREVTLEVKDHGKGITPEALARITQNRSSGVGLRGMRERIRQLAGRFDIESNGAGVSVTAVLPLEIKVS
ncbi:MAG: PAS domain S-box protein [Acidipila sp.]|nr:PAS domain S-box protein [Acidipila sp.]